MKVIHAFKNDTRGRINIKVQVPLTTDTESAYKMILKKKEARHANSV